MRPTIAACALATLFTHAAACGSSAPPPARPPSGGGAAQAPAVPAGPPSEDNADWRAGVAQFDEHERTGWDEASCREVSERFAQAGFAQAIYMAGLAASRCGNDARARELYTRALELDGRLCKARAALGVMDMDAGRTDAAARAFEQSIRDDARCTEGYVNLAIIQRGRGQVADSLNNLRRALAIDSNYLPAFNQMALLYLDQAQENPQMLDLAAVVCRQAQLIDADYAPIYNTWGLVQMRKGNVIEATQFFQRAMRLDADMFAAHMNFGQVTLSFRGYDDAKAAFERAVELKPDSYDAVIGLGVALRGLRQQAEAKARYERALALDANRPEALFNLGVLYQDYMSGSADDLRKAREYYQQFLAKAGNQPAMQATVAEVSRRCDTSQRRRRAQSTDCRPGRLQNLETALSALDAAAEMMQPSGATPSPAPPAAAPPAAAPPAAPPAGN